MRFFFFLLLLPMLAGCLSPAKSLEKSALNWIQEGSSTRSAVEKQLGKPKEIKVGSNRKTVADYLFLMESPPSASQQPRLYLRTLSVLYDGNGVVEKWVHHESTKSVDRKVTSTTVGSPASNTGWILKGKTPVNNVVIEYGPPDFKSFTPEGDLVYGWIYVKRKRGDDIKAGTERFLVLVDSRGVVKDYAIRAELRFVP